VTCPPCVRHFSREGLLDGRTEFLVQARRARDASKTGPIGFFALGRLVAFHGITRSGGKGRAGGDVAKSSISRAAVRAHVERLGGTTELAWRPGSRLLFEEATGFKYPSSTSTPRLVEADERVLQRQSTSPTCWVRVSLGEPSATRCRPSRNGGTDPLDADGSARRGGNARVSRIALLRRLRQANCRAGRNLPKVLEDLTPVRFGTCCALVPLASLSPAAVV